MIDWNFLIIGVIYLSSIFAAHPGHSYQNDRLVDSLKVLSVSNNPEERLKQVKALNELSRLYRNQDKDSSIYFATKALEVATELGNKIEVINSLIKLGITHRSHAEPEKALVFYRKGLGIARRIRSRPKLSSLVNNMANVFKDMVQLDSAIHYGLENLKIKKEIGRERGISQAYNNLGTSYSDNWAYDLAIDAFKQSLSIEIGERTFKDIVSGQIIQLNSGAIRALNNLGNVYFQSDQIDSAEIVLTAVRTLGNEQLSPYQNANNLQGLANIYKAKSDYRQSIAYYVRGAEMYKEMGRLSEFSRGINNIGLSYLGLSKYDSTVLYLDSALNLARSLNDRDLMKVVELNLSEVYDSLGDYRRSLAHLRNFKSLDSSLYFIEQERNINEIRTLYEVEKIERDLLQKDLMYKEAELSRKTFQLSFGIATLLAVLIFYRLYAIRRLARQSKKLHDQEINQLLANQELKMIQAAIEAEDRERERIGEDLHDRLGSTLSATKMHVEAMGDGPDDKNDQTTIIKDLLDRAISDTREISHNIISGVLAKFGLLAALKDLRDTVLSANKIKINLNYEGFNGQMDEEEELHLFRVIQELVSNTLKHAHAEHIGIELRNSDLGYELIYSDDGIGFDVDKNSEGIGMKNIESRLTKIQAQWNIKSDARGTRVLIKVAA